MTAAPITPAARNKPEAFAGNLPRQGEWTYADYRALPDDSWIYQVIEGELFMSPAPRPRHQECIANLLIALGTFVKEIANGKVYSAPVDVVLGDFATPVQPDVLYIPEDRLDIVSEGKIDGAPDFIAEVLSPSNWLLERREKFAAYARAGVREYWIVDPDTRSIEPYVLGESEYDLIGKYESGESVESSVAPGFRVSVDAVCP